VELFRYGALALLAYLLGSIPTGYLVARAKGIDIRTVGSGNIGATNAFRVLGRPAGFFVLLVDFLKGLVACGLIPYLLLRSGEYQHTRVVPEIVAGLCAVLGHNYTCWLRFKGGKGIATSAGVLTALVPWALLTILTIWIVLFALTRYVSVGSLAASASLPFATWGYYRDWPLTLVTGAMGALAIYKHRGNIRRLLNGTEPQFSRSKEREK
jgi:acyl phosphate:glycerol-3-phosphate acyltransferase